MRRYTIGFALAVVAIIMFGAPAAEAAFNVFAFSCSSSGDIRVDVRGLGNTNICVEGTFDVDADCACVNNGGNCPADTKKQSIEFSGTSGFSVEPKNGRVNTTLSTENFFGGTGGICEPLQSQCGGGQTARSITETVSASYTVCTTTTPAGQQCSCSGQESLATASDGEAPDACDTSGVTFAGKKNSCLNLF